MEDYYVGLIVLESGICKLKDPATIKLQNLSPESDVNLSAHLQRYEAKWGVYLHPMMVVPRKQSSFVLFMRMSRAFFD